MYRQIKANATLKKLGEPSLELLFCRIVKLWETKGKSRRQQPILQIENGKKSQQETFPESVIGSQFFYVDQFVISASANKISAHRVDLSVGDAKLAKTFRNLVLGQLHRRKNTKGG